MGTSGTGRGCSWSFVPFLCKRTCLGPCSIRGLAGRISTNGIFCTWHDTNTLLCATWCPRPSSVVSIYIKRDAICSPSVGPFGAPKEEKRCAIPLLSSSSSKIYRFSFSTYCSQYQFMWHVFPIRFVPMFSGGGLRHALTDAVH